MCLNKSLPVDQVLAACPDGTDTLVVYKNLNERGGQLVSPHYKHVWGPGHSVAQMKSQNNGDAGFYVMLFEPGVMLASKYGHRIVRLTVQKKDIVAGGPDSFNSQTGMCLVVRKIYLSEKDWKDAISGKKQEMKVAKIRKTAKKVVKKAKKLAKKKTTGERMAARVKRTTKKTVKKVAKKTRKATKTVAKAKKSVKKAKKITKKLAAKTTKTAKTVAKAKRSARRK